MSARASMADSPHLPYAPVAVRQVRLGAQEPVSTARSLVPALITDLLLLAVAAAAGLGISWFAREMSGSAGRMYVLVATVVTIAVTALLLRRGAQHGRPAMWATMVCIGWGVIAALWVPDLLLNLLSGSGWSEGVFTADTLPILAGTTLAVQALVALIVLLPALLAPQSLRGWARGFTTAAAAGLGYGGMQAVLILTGGHLVGLEGDASLVALAHAMSLPVLQAFVSGWGGLVLGSALTKGRSHLLYGWPLGVLVSAAASTLIGGVIRARVLCHTDSDPDWCNGQEPEASVITITAVTVGVLALGVAVTAAALGQRCARLREAAFGALVEHGWYTEAEAQALSTRPARRRLTAWSRSRGAGAQARSLISTADAIIAIRLEIEDLPDPVPEPCTPRAGLLAEQETLLQRSLSARESLRTAVAHGPGGWTAS